MNDAKEVVFSERIIKHFGMMTVDDVMEELGVKRSKAYSILKQLNDELAKEGYVAVRGKIPRLYWETKFYGCSQRAG